MKLTNNLYDTLRRWIQPILTGLATFVVTIGEVWNIPQYKAISITLGAMATFLAYVLNEVSKNYFSDKEIINNEVVDNNKELG